jgi:hypothetical protein
MTKPTIPFSLHPRHWGLQGKDRRIAQAKYELSGRELDIALKDIEIDDHDSIEYKLAILDIDFKFKKLSQHEFEKQRANLLEEPYFKVITGDYHPTSQEQGTMVFELDWNDHFVEELRQNGWKGLTPDAIVDAWFEDACKQMFDEAALESETEPPVTAYNRTRRKPHNGGTTEYS